MRNLRQQSLSRGPNSRGVSIIAAIFIIVILAFMGTMLVSLLNTATFSSLNDMQSAQALYIAEGGIQRALRYLQLEGGRCQDITTVDAALFTNIALGDGAFTVTAILFRQVPSERLTVAVNDVAAAISATATAGYAPAGRIYIQNDPPPGAVGTEAIDYTSINAVLNTFDGCRRGMDGTTASAHNANRRIVQNQCDIVSTGSIGNVQRQVQLSVQQ